MDYELIKNKKIVEKTDLWRLMIVYEQGGIYQDIDRLCNIPFNTILDEDTKCVLPTYLDDNFSQDIIISSASNIILETAIKLNLERRRKKKYKLYFLGPETYFAAITLVLIGEELKVNPGFQKMTQLRSIIEECTYLKTYREVPPFNTFLYQGPNIFDFEFEKDLMYKNEYVKHWTK
jgi:hypothetical protein